MDTASGPAVIREAHDAIRDLFAPVPRAYWLELTVTGTAGWATLASAIAAASAGRPAVAAVAVAVAALIWHRATIMVHELTHQRRNAIPGFHLAWNLVVGVAWLFPSVMYERVHSGHHRRTTYGTAADPEYLALAGRPWAIAGYLGFVPLAFPLLFLRFLVLAPASWLVPTLRRFILRHGSSYSINLRFARQTTRAERRRIAAWEAVVLAAWWPPVALTLAGHLPWAWLACWYGVHTGATAVNRLRMLTAHRFASDGRPSDHLSQFADSIDTPGGWWTVLWAPLGGRYHALHHLFPTLPFHSLGPAYRRIRTRLPADSFYHTATGPGWLGTVRALVGRLPTAQVRPPAQPTGGPPPTPGASG
ncbi:MAG TPA: fatty acid desaturase [Gemmataceae bacterium]|nr:fatty acid desaturase [Gemmataceae bacterium]